MKTGFRVEYYSKYDKTREDIWKDIIINPDFNVCECLELYSKNKNEKLVQDHELCFLHLIQVIDSEGVFLDVAGFVLLRDVPRVYVFKAYKNIINPVEKIQALYRTDGFTRLKTQDFVLELLCSNTSGKLSACTTDF